MINMFKKMTEDEAKKFRNFGAKYIFLPLAIIGMVAVYLLFQFSPEIITPPANGSIAIKIEKLALTPFDVINIKGGGLDPNAATSILFTVRTKEVLAVPALEVTANELVVPVPPIAYSNTETNFSPDQVSIKVIQVKKVNGKLIVKTSNEIKGIMISAPKMPSAFTSVGAPKIPKGAVTRMFVALAVERLKLFSVKTQPATPELYLAIEKGQKGMEELLSAVEKINKNPSALAKLKTTDGGTASISAKDIAWMDAYFSAYLAVLEKQPLASNAGTFEFIAAANAGEESACATGMLNDKGRNPALDWFAKQACNVFEPTTGIAPKPDDRSVRWEYLPEIPFFALAVPYIADKRGFGKPAELILSTLLSIGIDKSYSDKNIDKNTYFTLTASILAEMGDAKLLAKYGKGVPIFSNLLLAIDIYDYACAALPKFDCMDSRSIMQQTGQITMDLWENPENFVFLTNEMVDGLLKPLVDAALMPANSSNEAFDGGFLKPQAPTPTPKITPKPVQKPMPTPGSSPKPFSKEPINSIPVPDSTYNPPTPPAPLDRTCERAKKAANDQCWDACSSKPDTCYDTYYGCSPGCDNIDGGFLKLDCINTCLAAWEECLGSTGPAATCNNNCINANNAYKCP